jgi:membrane-associated HD superfamily phosphohydrolase
MKLMYRRGSFMDREEIGMSEKASNKRPELSTKPVPKDPPKGSFMKKVVVLISVGVFIFGGVTMKRYSDSIDRGPTNWDSTDWMNYLTFSRETAKDATDKMKAKIQSVDWDKVKTKITEKTKALWNKLAEMENEIEAKLKKEEEKRTEVAAKKKDNAKGPPPPKTNYEKSLEAMRDALRHYRNSPNSQKAIKDAKFKFTEAQKLLEKALNEVPPEQKPEVESMLQECNQYVYDCIKREKA